MKKRMGQFISIARLTLLDVLRQNHFLFITMTVLAGISCMPLLITYTLGDSAMMVQDATCALYLSCGLLLAAVSAGATLSREMRSGTAATVLSKPVNRTLFFFAKYAGLAAALFLYSLAAGFAILLSIRTADIDYNLDWTASGPAIAAFLGALLAGGIWNRQTRRPFTTAAFFFFLLFYAVAAIAAAGIPTPFMHSVFPANMPLNVLPLLGLLFLSLLLFAALASTLAARLDAMPVLAITLLCFCIGLMSDYFLGPHLHTSLAARTLYALIPNAQAFWVMDALHNGNSIPAVYILSSAAYAICWSAACLLCGAWAIRRMEISGNPS